MKKNFLILISFLALNACTCPAVPCHRWTSEEITALKASDAAIPKDEAGDAMHALVKNYETICIE